MYFFFSVGHAGGLPKFRTEHALLVNKTEKWHSFPVPTFFHEVVFILDEGNTYERTGKTLKLSRGKKHDILEMPSFKSIPH